MAGKRFFRGMPQIALSQDVLRLMPTLRQDGPPAQALWLTALDTVSTTPCS